MAATVLSKDKQAKAILATYKTVGDSVGQVWVKYTNICILYQCRSTVRLDVLAPILASQTQF